MGALTQLCCFLIIFDITIATPIILLGVNNSHIYVDRKLQAPIDIIRINTGFITTDDLENLKTRVSTLEGLFEKLKISRASLPNKMEELQIPTQSSNNETGQDTSVTYPLEELQKPNNESDKLNECKPDQPIGVDDSELKISRASLPNKTEELQIPTLSSNNETGQDSSVAYPLEALKNPNNEPDKLKECKPDQSIGAEDRADTVNISEIVEVFYPSEENNFNVLINLSKGMSNTNHSLKVLQCLHSAMKENSDLSPTKLIILAKTFRDRILIDTNIEAELKTNITTTIEQLLDTVKAEATEHLITGMETDFYSSNANIHSMNEELYNFGRNFYNEIFQNSLNSIYSKLKTDVILANIISGKKSGPIISGIRVLLSKMKNSDDLNQNVVLRIASKLKELKSKYDFFELDKDDFEAAVSDLPTCARNLYFNASSICLWNIKQQSFLLAGNAIFNYDSKRRSIFVAPEAKTNRGAMWSVTNEGENFYFKSLKYYDNLYAEESTNHFNYQHSSKLRYVFNWIPSNDFYGQVREGEYDEVEEEEESEEDRDNKKSAWNIELEGDNCYIKSLATSEYLLASHETYQDFDLNRVFTAMPNLLDNYDRLWQVQHCQDD